MATERQQARRHGGGFARPLSRPDAPTNHSLGTRCLTDLAYLTAVMLEEPAVLRIRCRCPGRERVAVNRSGHLLCLFRAFANLGGPRIIEGQRSVHRAAPLGRHVVDW